MRDAAMKSLNTKMVLAAFGILAMLAGPAFAKQQKQATQAGAYDGISGYDGNGAVVEIPNPDQSGSGWQR
jgi:hypothetical protein